MVGGGSYETMGSLENKIKEQERIVNKQREKENQRRKEEEVKKYSNPDNYTQHRMGDIVSKFHVSKDCLWSHNPCGHYVYKDDIEKRVKVSAKDIYEMLKDEGITGTHFDDYDRRYILYQSAMLTEAPLATPEPTITTKEELEKAVKGESSILFAN